MVCSAHDQLPGIYVFHTWSFCAGRKTSTFALFELFIIIICWIFCAYTQILSSRDVKDFCVHGQKFLIMISDNKVFQHWRFCGYTQILNRDMENFCVHAQKFLIMISHNKVFQYWIFCAYTHAQKFLIAILDNKVFQRWIICTYTQILTRDVEVFCLRAQKFVIVILDNKVVLRWIICVYTQIFNRDEDFCAYERRHS